jgi:hypothetical protein
MRQLYGESTCTSKYSADARAKNLAADKIAGQQYLAKLAAPKTAASATPIASPGPTPIPTPAVAAKATTITCVKGKLTKKVTMVKPVCPVGYKKK